MKKGKVSSAKHANNQNPAVAYLRRMPMWQRVVSAVMAVLLAFLLWPADAAKTFRAWADAAAEAAAEQEAAIVEDDSGTTEDDAVTDADVGGEQSDEANLGAEACGPYEWDFSSYNTEKTLSRVTSGHDATYLDYADTNKIASMRFYSPVSDSKDATYQLDGSNSSLSKTNGWYIKGNHKLYADGQKGDPNGIVNISNYIAFTPTTDLGKLVLKCIAVYTDTQNRHPVIGIVKANGTNRVSSNDSLFEVEVTSKSSNQEVVFDPSLSPKLEGVFKANETYYIYVRPNATTGSSYNKYGAIKLKNIKAEKPQASVRYHNEKAPCTDTLTFSLENTNKTYKKDIPVDAVKDLPIEGVIFDGLQVGDVVTLTVKSDQTGRSASYMLTNLQPGQSVVEASQLDLAQLYLTLNGTFKNDGSPGDFKFFFGDALIEEKHVTDQYDFSFVGLGDDAMLRVESSEDSTSFDEIYVPSTQASTIDNIILNIKDNKTNLIIKNKAWDESAGEIDNFVHQKVYYLCKVAGQEWQTYRRYIEPNIIRDEDGKITSMEYPSTIGTTVYIVTDPNGLYAKNSDGEKITSEGIVLAENTGEITTILPTYKWETDNSGNWITTEYKCTAKYTEFEGRYYERTIYTKEQPQDVGGKITRNVISRPTDSADGQEELTATWTIDDEYFYPPQVVQRIIDKDDDGHTHTMHDGTEVKFNTKWTSSSFPTAAGNYYLTQDVTISGTSALSITGDVKVDLNGYAVKISMSAARWSTAPEAIKISNTGSLLLYDCCKDRDGCEHYFKGNTSYSKASDRTAWTLSNESDYDYVVKGGVITGAIKSAILNEGTLKCEDVQFVGNQNTYNSSSFGEGSGGGAIRSGDTNYATNLDLYGCEFLGNTSQGTGGAVLVGVSNSALSTSTSKVAKATIENTHFAYNHLLGESSSTSGYVVPWGGGALATNNSESGTGISNPVLNIKGCNFDYNSSNYRGGAILLFHGTECHMSDTTISNNTSGWRHETVSSTSVCYNYGGGVNLYTGVSSNSHQAFLYLSGKVVIRHNNSREYKNSKETWHEDNLALQFNDGAATKGYVRFDTNPITGVYPALTEDSFVGINYAKNTNVDCTIGYAEGELVGEDLTDPSVKNFYLDDVVNRYECALLIQMGQTVKGQNATYELWIVKHKHDFDYVTSSTRNNNVFDRMTINCCTEGDEKGYTIDGVKYFFSKCMYGLDPLELTIHSQDGGDDGKTIPYDPGVEHPCVIDNADEFEEYLGGQYAGGIEYYKKNDDGHGTVTWDKINGVPVEPGIYRGKQSFYETVINDNYEVVVDTSKVHSIVSNEYEIAGSNLQVEILTEMEKDYDGSDVVHIGEAQARLKGRVGADDDVHINVTGDFDAYSESPYVSAKNGDEYIPWNLSGFDTNKVKLVGADAWKYHLSGISGTVVIKPVDQNIFYEPLQLWPKQDGEESGQPYDLVDKIRGLQGNPKVVLLDDVDKPFTDPENGYATLTPEETKNIISVTADAAKIASCPDKQDLDDGLLGFYRNAYVQSIAPVDINGDGVYEFNGYDRDSATEEQKEFNKIPLTFLSGLYDQTEIHFKVGYLDKDGKFIEEPSAGSVMVGANAVDSAKIVKSKSTTESYPRITHNANESKINFYDVAQQWRNFNIVSKDASKWEFASIITPDDNIWDKSAAGEYNWKEAETIDYNYDFKIVFNKLSFPSMDVKVTAETDPVDAERLDFGNKVTYTVTVKNDGNIDFDKGTVHASLCSGQTIEGPAIDETLTFTFEHIVTEADIIAGSFTNVFYVENNYNDEAGSHLYTTPNISITHLTVSPRYIAPTMTLSAQPLTSTSVTYGDEIQYFATIKNNSNVSLTGTVLTDELVGHINEDAIKVFSERYPSEQRLAPSEEVTIEIPNKYIVDNVPVSGNILNVAEFVGYINIGGVDKLYKCTADIEHHMGYAEIDIPTEIGNIAYKGYEQFGINFIPNPEHPDNADKIDVVSSEIGRDVGKYTVICKPKPWYKWESSQAAARNVDPLGTIEISYEITPATLEITYQSKEGNYTGLPLSFVWKDETGYLPTSEIVSGFVNAGEDYEPEGVESITLTTNGSNVLYKEDGTVDSYVGNGNGLKQNKLAINTKANTKLSNYTIVYKEDESVTDFSIKINPRNLNDKEWISAKSGKNFTYDEQPHSAIANVELFNKDVGLNLQLIEGVDWVFDSTSEVTKTDASWNVGEQKEFEYIAKIDAKEQSNFTGSIEVGWKILRRAITINVVGNSFTTSFNGSKQSILGHDPSKTTWNDPAFLIDPANVQTTEVIKAEGTTVGTYKMSEQIEDIESKFYYDEGDKDNILETFTFSGGILQINPMSIEDTSVTEITERPWTYDALLHVPNITVKAGETVLASNVDYVISEQTEATDAGSYSIVVTGTGNYTGTRTFVWHINPLDIYISNGASAEKVYDDKVLTKSVEQDIYGGSIVYNLVTNGVDAGVYGGTDESKTINVTYTLNGKESNYIIHKQADPAETQPTLTINQRPIKLVAGSSKTFKYDAQPHYIDMSYINYEALSEDQGVLNQHKVVNALWDGQTSLNHVGTISAVPYALQVINPLNNEEVTDNYYIDNEGADPTASLTIQKRSMKVEVVGNSSTVTYDGQEHIVNGYTVKEVANTDNEITGLFDRSQLTPSSSEVSTGSKIYVNNTAADAVYPLLYSNEVLEQDDFEYLDGNINCEITYIQGGLKIDKKNLKFNVSDSKLEDAEGQTPLGHTIDTKSGQILPGELSGLAEGDNLYAAFETASWEQGTYSYGDEEHPVNVNLSFENPECAGSYTIAYDVVLTISSNLLITIKTSSANYVFDGTKKEMSNTWDESLPEKTNLTITTSGTGFDISKLHCSAPSKLEIAGTNVGTYQYPLSAKDFYYDNNSNDPAAIKVVLGTLEITPFDLQNATVTGWKDSPLTYTHGDLMPTVGNISEAVKIPNTNYTIWLNDVYADQYTETNVGNYTFSLTPKSANFKGSLEKDWSITKGSITIKIKGHKNTVTYNGYTQYLTGYNNEVVKTSEGLNAVSLGVGSIFPLPSDVVVSGTDAGTYNMNLKPEDFSYVDSDNVEASFIVEDGALTISQASLTDLIDIIPGQTEFTYDGTEKVTTPTAVWKSTGKSFDMSNFNVTGNSWINAKLNIECNISWSGLTNFTDSSWPYQWNIYPAHASIDIIGKTKTVEYNGQLQPDIPYADFDAVATSSSDLIDTSFVVYEGEGIQETDAGTYWANFDPALFSYQPTLTEDNKDVPNVEFSFSIKKDASLVINPIDISNASFHVEDRDLTYNFADQGPKYKGFENPALDPHFGDQPLEEGKDYHVSGQTAQNSNNYTMTITGIGNFKGTLTYSWQIKKLAMSAEIHAKDSQTVQYDGTQHFIKGYLGSDITPSEYADKININPGENDIVVSGTDVGEYSMNIMRTNFTCDNNNIDFSYTVDHETNLIIEENSTWDTKFNISATNLTYNSKEQTTCITLTDGLIVLKEGVDFEVVNEEGVYTNKAREVGSYTAQVKPIGNFTGANKTVTWSIGKANMNIEVVGSSQSLTYDGLSHIVGTFEGEGEEPGYTIKSDNSLFDIEKVVYNEEYTIGVSRKDVGITTADIDLDETGLNISYSDTTNFNVTFTSTQVSLAISKKAATLTKSASQVFTTEHALSVNFDQNDFVGLVNNEVLSGTLKTNSIVAATYNTCDDTAVSGFTADYGETKALTENYNISYNVTLTIVPTSNVVLVQGNISSVTYNNSKQSVDGYSVLQGDSTKVHLQEWATGYDHAEGTDAGTYYMGLTAEHFTYDDEGYIIQVIDGYININKKNINECTITVEPTEFVYTGQEQGPIVTIKDGASIVSSSNYELSNGVETNAGNYNLTIVGIKNYTGVIDNGYLWSIRKADAVVNVNADIEFANDFVTYEFSSSDVSGVLGSDELYGRLTTRGMKIGTYTYNPADLTAADGIDLYELNDATKNYNLIYNVRINIIKHVLNIDPGYQEFTYDGQPHYILESQVNYYGSGGEESVGVLPGHAVTIVGFSNRSQTNYGHNTKVQVDSVTIKDANGNDVQDNYLVNFMTGEIYVKKANIALQITGNHATFPYDGKAHTVEGYDAYEIPAEGQTQITGLFDKTKLTTKDQLIATQTEPGKTWMLGDPEPEANFIYNDNNINFSYIYTNGYSEVVASDWANVVVSTTNVTYNGNAQNANLKVMNGNQYLVEGVDYTIAETEKAKLTRTKSGKVEFEIQSAGKYGTGLTKPGTWEIYQANVTVSVTGNSATVYYDSQEKEVVGANYRETTSTGLFKPSAVQYLKTTDAPSLVATDPGVYNKGLKESDFSYYDEASEGDINVKFVINKDMQLTINKPNIGEQNFNASAGDQLVYNGITQTPTLTITQTTTNAEGEEVTITLVLGRDYKIVDLVPQKFVGTYYVTVEGMGNYVGQRQNIPWQIVKRNMTISYEGLEKTVIYNGQYQNISAATSSLTFESSDILYNRTLVDVNSNVNVGGVDVGTYSLSLTPDMFTYRDNNINAIFEDGGTSSALTLKIDPKHFRITAVETKIKDEEALVHNILQTEVEGTVAGQVVTGTAVSYKNDTPSSEEGTYPDPERPENKVKFNVAIDGKPVNVEPTNDGETSNYILDSDSELRIVTASEDKFVKIQGYTYEYDYDGETHVVPNTAYSVSTNVENFDASKLQWGGLPADGIQGTSVKRDATSHEVLPYKWEGVEAKYNDGVITVDCEIVSPQLIINPRDINNVVVDGLEHSYEYNKVDHRPEIEDSITVKDPDEGTQIITENDYVISFEHPAAVAPGLYAVIVTSSETGNYTGEKWVDFTISNAIRIVEITGNSNTLPYNGNPQVCTGYTFEEKDQFGREPEKKLFDGVLNPFTPSPNNVKAEGTNVGTYNMGIDASVFTYNGRDSDYIQVGFVLVQDGSLTITNGQLSVKFYDPDNPETEIDSYNPTYDGTLKQPLYKVFWGEKEVPSNNYIVTGTTTAVDANESYSFTVTGTGMYAGFDSAEASWSIQKAARTIRIKGNTGTKTYNGTLQSVVGYTFEEIRPDEETAYLIKSDKINSGVSPVSVEAQDVKRDSSGNVDKYMMEIDPSKFSYDDSNITPTFELASDGDGWIQINPCYLEDVTTIVSPESFVYDKNPHHPDLTMKNGDEILNDPSREKPDYKVEGLGDQTDIGTYTYTITIPEVSSGNYIIDPKRHPDGKITGEWMIVPAKMDIYITGSNNEGSGQGIEYDGEEHQVGGTAEDPGFSAECSSDLFDEDQICWNYDPEHPSVKNYPSAVSSEVGLTLMNLNAGDFTYLQTPVQGGLPIEVVFHIKQDGWIRITNKTVDYDDLLEIPKPEYTFTNGDIAASFNLTLEGGGGDAITLIEGQDYDVYDNVGKYVKYNEDGEIDYYKDSKIVFKGNYTGTLINTSDTPVGKELWFKINKATLELLATGKKEVVTYDGQEHRAAGYTLSEKDESSTYHQTGMISLIDQNKVRPTIGDVFISKTNKGRWTEKMDNPEKYAWTYPEDPNLNVGISVDDRDPGTSDHVILEIKGKKLNEADLQINVEQLVYNGQEQFPQIEVIDTAVGKLGEWDITISGDKKTDANVGDYYTFDIKAFESGDEEHESNYEGELLGSEDPRCRWTIAPKPVTYTFVQDNVHEYDAQPVADDFNLNDEDHPFPDLCGTEQYNIKLSTMTAENAGVNASTYPYKVWEEEQTPTGDWLSITANPITSTGAKATNYIFTINQESVAVITPYNITSDESCRVKFKMTSEIIYDGKVHSPQYRLYDTAIEVSEGVYYDLQAAKDYNSTYVPKKHVNYTNPDNPSEDEHYTVDFEAKGNYTGKWGSEWKITPKKVYAYSLNETKDPKITEGARNKEYDGTPCVIEETLGNRTSETYRVSDMLVGDYVDVSWATVGVDVKYDSSGNVAPYVMTDGSKTEITLTPTDAANSPCYARDYEFLLDAQISIWPRTIDKDEFDFYYKAPIYNATEQIVYPSSRGEVDPTDPGAAWVYDKTLKRYLTTDDFVITGTKYKNVPLPGVGPYKATINGKGNYREYRGECEWTIAPYKFTYAYNGSKMYDSSQYNVSADVPNGGAVVFGTDKVTLQWKTWKGLASDNLPGSDAGTYTCPYIGPSDPVAGELTFDNVTSDAQTRANYDIANSAITGEVVIEPRDIEVEITIDPLTYNGEEQLPGASQIKAYDKVSKKYLVFGANADFYYDGTQTPHKNVPAVEEVENYTLNLKGLNNYAGLSASPKWVINPAPYTFKFEDLNTFTYKGSAYDGVSPLTNSTIMESGRIFGKDAINVTWSTNGVNAGDYYLNWNSENANLVTYREEAATGTDTDVRNYTSTYKAHVVINKKNINDDSVEVDDDLNPDTDYPEYTGDVVYPTFHIVDTEVGTDELVYGRDYIIDPGGVDVKTDGETYTSNAKAVESGNYTGLNGTDVIWNVRSKAVAIVVDDTKEYDGEIFASHFKLETGTIRVDQGNTPEEVYINSETDSAEVGTYIYEPEANDGQVFFDPVEGIEAGFEWMKLTNFDFEAVDPQITLHITEVPVPPEPTPPEPEYVDAQTGDMALWTIYGLLASAVVCAFIAIRRRKHSADKRWNA